MIQEQTLLKVLDNSGIQTVKCIKVLGGFKKKYANLGGIIIVSVQKIRNMSKKNSKFKKGDLFKALIIRTNIKHINKTGYLFCFDENAVVLMNKKTKPLGTRIIGPIPKILRYNKIQRFVSISTGII